MRLRFVKLLLCDIDGTLTGASGRGHSARLMPLMRQLMERGVKIGVVSGRDTLSALSVHRLFDLNGPIIGENGARLILDPVGDEWRSRKCGGLSSSQKAALMRVIHRRGLFGRFAVDPGKESMLTLVPTGFRPHAPDALPAWSGRLAAALKPWLSDLEVTYSSLAIDICARGTNKGKGIALACRALHTAPGAVAFVGDSSNDRSAFEFVRCHQG